MSLNRISGNQRAISSHQRMNLRRSAFRGQATIEWTAAMLLALVLLLLCIKLFLWFAERFVTRQKAYEATRVQAATTSIGSKWAEPLPMDLQDE